MIWVCFISVETHPNDFGLLQSTEDVFTSFPLTNSNAFTVLVIVDSGCSPDVEYVFTPDKSK